MSIVSKFRDISDEELRAELDRRIAESNKIPEYLEEIDLKPLLDYLKDSLDTIALEEIEPKDFDHRVFELAMVAVYGPKIWDWINKHVH